MPYKITVKHSVIRLSVQLNKSHVSLLVGRLFMLTHNGMAYCCAGIYNVKPATPAD